MCNKRYHINALSRKSDVGPSLLNKNQQREKIIKKRHDISTGTRGKGIGKTIQILYPRNTKHLSLDERRISALSLVRMHQWMGLGWRVRWQAFVAFS